MKVRAAVLHEVGSPFVIETIDLEGPRAGEVLVKVAAVGVCHSDWHLRTGDTPHPLPVVPGHEGSGVVAEVGPGVAGVAIGDRVALNWAPYCGDCYYCRVGQRVLCKAFKDRIWSGVLPDGTSRLSLNGRTLHHYTGLSCFADYCVVHATSVVPMPPQMPLDVAALIGCAVTTGVGAVVNTAAVPPGASVAVFGAGGVGLSAILGAQIVGAHPIIAVDRTPQRGATARTFGASHALVGSNDIIEEIRLFTEGRGVDFAFDCTGVPKVQRWCLDAIRPGGAAVLVGLAPGADTIAVPTAAMVRQEKTLSGSYYGSCDPARDFPGFADLFLQGMLPIDRLATRRYSLEQINEAYEDMLVADGGRGVIQIADF
ncbi:MAG: alcohol dehydrogenase catalytic domain-containing protein [Phycisphaera sp.]|nr:alcohol dehydrogenase catalytic domain-containing protein [Phycisphaera sp.]